MTRDQMKEHHLTAYALGELDPEERAAVEAWVAEDAEARALLDELRATADLLRGDLATDAEVGLTPSQRARIARGPAPTSRPRRGWGLGLAALAAGVLAFAVWPREAADGPGDEGDAPGLAAGVDGAGAGEAEGLDPEAPGVREVQPPVVAEVAPPASPRLADVPAVDVLTRGVRSWFEGRPAQRLYVQVDKPLYRPGETIWIKTWDVAARDLSGSGAAEALTYQLVDPRGAVVQDKLVRADRGRALGEFELPAALPGGEYIVRARGAAGVESERRVIVASYQAPRIRKRMEFVRRAYGPGDEVAATLELTRPTGEPVAEHEITGVVRLDGHELPRVIARTNRDGGAVVRFSLPPEIDVGDGLLTVMVEDGGVTESISRRVPIVMRRMQLSLYPEGGDLVAGLESRVYFAARDPLGKPADVRGRVVDDHGQVVAELESHKHGLGRFALLPATGRRYMVEIDQPANIAERFALPRVRAEGCVLRTFDDLDGQLGAIRVGVRCTEERSVIVAATKRERPFDVAAVTAGPREEAIVYLETEDAALARAQGVARVTIFDEGASPVAERLIYRNRRHRLTVEVEPDRERYTPGDEVSLSVRTLTPEGEPVSAELALSVVDDTVVSFADDKRGHLLSRLFLEPELPGDIEEPNFYLDLTEPDSALALELLMGTHGYRRFEWQPVVATGEGRYDQLAMHSPRTRPRSATGAPKDEAPDATVALAAVEATPQEQQERPLRDRARGAELAQLDERPARVEDADEPFPMENADGGLFAARGEAFAELEEEAAEAEPPMEAATGAVRGDLARPLAAREAAQRRRPDQPGGRMGRNVRRPAPPQQPTYAVARVFPIPTPRVDLDAPRRDFRDTVLWAPTVTTDGAGRGMVRFVLSDAVTSFRVFAEGLGGGLAGRSETVLASSLPLSMSARLPTAVTSQDALRLPLTLDNEGDEPLTVEVEAELGEHLALLDPSQARRTVVVPPGARETLFYEARPRAGAEGTSRLAFTARVAGLRDAVTQELLVAPAGFPQEIVASGELRREARHDVVLTGALPATVRASVRLYPSPMATMIGGLDGMLREPHGCFEQASSASYPNVMVMQYMQAHELDDVAVLSRARRLLDAGYQRLTSYETPSKGYEWFGHSPGHEALTAYGLTQFHDMGQVHEGVDADMMARTAAWLLSRRDGSGGYQVNPRALDSFGRASKAVTDAYITYALTEAGWTDLRAELAQAERLAASATDAYVLALTANTLLNVDGRGAAGRGAVERLRALQDDDGAWTGAQHSITRSTGRNLAIETTALALMALLQAEDRPSAAADRAAAWLQGQRGAFGGFGSTQATVLTLKALTRFAEARRMTRSAGRVVVLVDGREVASLAYEAGHHGPLVIDGLGVHLVGARHRLELRHEGEHALPYTMAIEHRVLSQPSDRDAAVGLAAELDRSEVRLGETVRLTATVTNRRGSGQGMTLARLGLPGGLTFQTWQLQELRDRGLIAFYETGPQEVVLYFRDLAPEAVHRIPLDLVAVVPGAWEGPASSAYLYYDDDLKSWVDGVTVGVAH